MKKVNVSRGQRSKMQAAIVTSFCSAVNPPSPSHAEGLVTFLVLY